MVLKHLSCGCSPSEAKGSCNLGLQHVFFLVLSYFSLIVGLIFCWNNMLKLAKQRLNGTLGWKQGRPRWKEGWKSTVTIRWVLSLRREMARVC